MPTFASAPLKNLVETRRTDSPGKPINRRREQEDLNPDSDLRLPRLGHLYISPALYATPKPSPIPEFSSADPVFGSPYVLNHKRRNGMGEKGRGAVSRLTVTDLTSENEGGGYSFEEKLVEGSVGYAKLDAGNVFDVVGDDSGDRFIDARSETMSVGSEVESDDFDRQMDGRKFVIAQGEFLDANDDFSEDGSTHSTPSRIASQLQATRLGILEEIDRRQAAEESLMLMRSQWEKIQRLFHQAGLTFPVPPACSEDIQLVNSSIDQLLQQFVISKFVDEAIGESVARAETEAVVAEIIQSKDQEMLRLRDRLQYYETVIHEMSQRKLVEVACKQQEKKRNRRRWVWSLTGFSIAIGVSFLAYSYLPQAKEFLSIKLGHLPDSSSTRPSDSLKKE